MTTPSPPPGDEFPPERVTVDQVERYRFEVRYPETDLRALTVDEPAPVGTGAGPGPALALAGAIGHCLGSTLFNSLERAHVPATPIRTAVTVSFGRNARGRKRVVGLDVTIDCAPKDEADRSRFDRCVAIFEDYCTVTGAVREGIPVRATVRAESPAPAGGVRP